MVSALHDPESRFLTNLFAALREGKLCIVDISQMSGSQSLILSSLILRKIFEHNQEEFTKSDPASIPVVAVIEEAQSVLDERKPASEPYIEWVKEGRKYDLGAVLITQQPGSISSEILSQGDNWFVFHLLSSTDLTSLQRANAHLSTDILSTLLNEPIPGQGVFWSSTLDKPYPLSIRAMSFEELYQPTPSDRLNHHQATFARELKARSESRDSEIVSLAVSLGIDTENVPQDDLITAITAHFIKAIPEIDRKIKAGIKKYRVIFLIRDKLPASIDEKQRQAMIERCLSYSLDAVFGQGQWEELKDDENKPILRLRKSLGESNPNDVTPVNPRSSQGNQEPLPF